MIEPQKEQSGASAWLWKAPCALAGVASPWSGSDEMPATGAEETGGAETGAAAETATAAVDDGALRSRIPTERRSSSERNFEASQRKQ